MAAVLTQSAAPSRGVDRDDLSWIDLVVLLLCSAVGLGLVLLAAFGVYPFAGAVAVYVLLYLLAAAGHALAVSLIVVAAIEDRHPRWTFLGIVHYVVMAVVTVALIVGLFILDRWVVHVGLGARVTGGYFIVAGVASVIVAVMTYLTMRPRGWDGSKEYMGLHVLAGIIGLTLGAGAMAGVIGYLAWHRQANLQHDPITIPMVHGITGSYLALGDSYSAGEGLPPFDPATGAIVTGGNDCHRSGKGYSQLLVFDSQVRGPQFTACSGAVVADIDHAFHHNRTGRPPITVGPQVDGAVHPDVGLVTLTIGGNNVLFSDIVVACFRYSNCMAHTFPSARPRGEDSPDWPDTRPLQAWGPAATQVVGIRVAEVYKELRAHYPNARIVAIGYPYLFPGSRAGLQPNDCASILRRYSLVERKGIRALEDQFNNLLYEQAVAHGIEFVSPVAAWEGHEPCGTKGQYVNSIKPILNVSSPVDGGSFHPTADGQRLLAALVGCYLDLNPQRGPNPFVGGQHRDFTVTGLVEPSALGLVDAPGSKSRLNCNGLG